MQAIKTTSPAYAREAISGEPALSELPWIGKINLRGNPQNSDFLEKAKSALQCDLPLEAHSLATHGDISAFWTGPDEWLIYCNIDQVAEISSKLQDSLEDIHCAITDVSDYYTVLKLEGPGSIELLRKACPMDLHPDVFKAGSNTQTRFGHASIMLHKLDDTPSFHIQIRWSYTEYLWDYLVSAMEALDV